MKKYSVSERERSQFPTPTNKRGGAGKPWLGGRPKVTIRRVGKATWILFPPRALPIEKEIKLKTTEIGSLTEMVRPKIIYVFLVPNRSKHIMTFIDRKTNGRNNRETNGIRPMRTGMSEMYEGANMSNKGLRMSNSLVRISIVLFCLIFFYLAFLLIDIDSDLFWLKVKWTIFSKSLSLLFSRLGFGGLALAIGLAVKAILTADGGLSIGNGMMPHGAAESTNSDLFTYTSDLVEDSASSGRSRSTSTVNQPLPGEQAMPPALPVMQEAANQAPPVPYPYPHDYIIGGDSVESIERRILGGSPSPSAHDIRMSRIQAEDLFEVKVDICQVMAGLHPSGDWLARGARALDNPRTATGEESLNRLHQMLDDLQTGGLQSATFRLLVDRVPFRADEDQHSAA